MGFRHVLLVAMDSVNELAHHLRGGQLGVTTAHGTSEALSLLGRGGVDCVVVHPSVPREDRLALRKAVGARGVPIVVAKPSTTGERANVLVAQILGLLYGPEVTRVSLLPETRGHTPRPSLSSKTILVVDDDEDMLRALKRSLARLRCTVVTANGVPRALELLGAISIDLVVSDYSLGAEQTGLDLLATVRSKSPRTKRLLLTGHTPDRRDLAGDLGAADRVLTKPWEPEELFAACYTLLGIDPASSN